MEKEEEKEEGIRLRRRVIRTKRRLTKWRCREKGRARQEK